MSPVKALALNPHFIFTVIELRDGKDSLTSLRELNVGRTFVCALPLSISRANFLQSGAYPFRMLFRTRSRVRLQ